MLTRLIRKRSAGLALAGRIRDGAINDTIESTTVPMLKLAVAIIEDIGATDSPEYVDFVTNVAEYTKKNSIAFEHYRAALKIYTEHPTRGFGLGLAAIWFSGRLGKAGNFAECARWFEVAADFTVTHPGATYRDIYNEHGFEFYVPALEAIGRHDEAAKWRQWETKHDQSGKHVEAKEFAAAWAEHRKSCVK